MKELVEDETVQSMGEISHHLTYTCLEHSLFVSYVSYRFCKFMNWDYKAAARGGLLHDLFLYDWKDKGSHEGLHGFTHPKAACRNAEELCRNKDSVTELTGIEKDMILSHMWPLTSKPPKYKESYVVCFADKLCALTEMLFIFGFLRFKSRSFKTIAQTI